MTEKKPLEKELKHEVAGIALIAFAVLCFLSIITFFPTDPPNSGQSVVNMIGVLGAWISYITLTIFGNLAYVLPIGLFYWGAVLLFNKLRYDTLKIISATFFFIFLSVILEFHAVSVCKYQVWDKGSGALPAMLHGFFARYFGVIGAHWVLLVGMLITSILFFKFLFKKVLIALGIWLSALWITVKAHLKRDTGIGDKGNEKNDGKKDDGKLSGKNDKKTIDKEREYFYVPQKRSDTLPAVREQRLPLTKDPELPFEDHSRERQPVALLTNGEVPESLLPPADLLNTLPKRTDKENTDETARLLEESLAHFDISATVIGVSCGPMASMYEMSVERGTKINKLESLDRELALMLSKDTVRIIAPLPGRGTIGIEVPNTKREFVSLRELIETKQFAASTSPLAIGFGRGMDGEPIIVHLEELPHLLIAGATMSGKSIGIHTIIMSLLYKTPYTDLRLILIDPKRLEFPYYNGIPHLLTNVIVEPAEAVNTLKWALFEMDRRYKLLAHNGARDIQSYNQKFPDQKIPYLVIMIDELADLMMTTGPDTENAIIRLAQMARAVGIHLILATQRPSADVITGTIKANFPSRIAYKTASKSNSRIILDENGAESLLGKGDFLYLKITGELIRGQGALVTVPEITKTVQYLKQLPPPNDEFTRQFNDQREVKIGDASNRDDLYQEALRIVYNNLSAGNDSISTSFLQRKLSIGYNRAARIIEDLEADGIVDVADGAKPRTIIAELETLDTIVNGSNE